MGSYKAELIQVIDDLINGSADLSRDFPLFRERQIYELEDEVSVQNNS